MEEHKTYVTFNKNIINAKVLKRPAKHETDLIEKLC